MIYDCIKNIGLYKGISARLDRALDHIESLADAGSSFKDGRSDIDGENIFAVSSSYETQKADTKRHEAHRKYIDLQYMHEGVEKINVASYVDIEKEDPYDGVNDIYFADAPDKCVILMKKGDFAVFFPTDLHKPGIAAEEPSNVKKVVVKIRV